MATEKQPKAKLFAVDIRYYVAAQTKEEARQFVTKELEMGCVRVALAKPDALFDCSEANDGSCCIPTAHLVARRLNAGEALPLFYGWEGAQPGDG